MFSADIYIYGRVEEYLKPQNNKKIYKDHGRILKAVVAENKVDVIEIYLIFLSNATLPEGLDNTSVHLFNEKPTGHQFPGTSNTETQLSYVLLICQTVATRL